MGNLKCRSQFFINDFDLTYGIERAQRIETVNFYLSPKDLSQAIDLSESSIKRWMDNGKIRADKTEGGHRKIEVDTAIQFIRAQRIPLVKPEILGFPDLAYLTGDPVTKESAPDRLYEFLLEGQTEQVRALLIYLYLNGQSVAEICDGPIRQSMSRIGELWRHEEAGIGLEHRATDICLDVLNRIRAIFRPEHDAPIALGGAPPGDPYFLPSLSVAAVLASEGMRSINYGPNTPFEVFYTAIEQYQLALVWLSISYKKHGMKLHGVIEELAAFSNQFGIKLIIGGKEAESIRFPLFSNVQWIASMVELVAFVKGLQANRIEKTH